MLTFQKVEPGEKKEERGGGGGQYRRSSPSGLHQKPKALDQPLLVHSSRVPGHSCLGIDQRTRKTTKQTIKRQKPTNQPNKEPTKQRTNQTTKNQPNKEPTRKPTNQGQKQWINPCSRNPHAWVPRIHCPCINLSCKSFLEKRVCNCRHQRPCQLQLYVIRSDAPGGGRLWSCQVAGNQCDNFEGSFLAMPMLGSLSYCFMSLKENKFETFVKYLLSY